VSWPPKCARCLIFGGALESGSAPAPVSTTARKQRGKLPLGDDQRGVRARVRVDVLRDPVDALDGRERPGAPDNDRLWRHRGQDQGTRSRADRRLGATVVGCASVIELALPGWPRGVAGYDVPRARAYDERRWAGGDADGIAASRSWVRAPRRRCGGGVRQDTWPAGGRAVRRVDARGRRSAADHVRRLREGKPVRDDEKRKRHRAGARG